MLVIGFRVHLNNPGSSHFKILVYIYKDSLPKRGTFIGSED
jgi:hypothetical protein